MTLSPCARVPSRHGAYVLPNKSFFALRLYHPRQIWTLYTSSSAVAPAFPFSPRPHASLSVLRKPPALTSSAFFTALSATHSSFSPTAVCVILMATLCPLPVTPLALVPHQPARLLSSEVVCAR
ncbi:unnamed protein product [Chondrus crispus]|uniref:Uncharacterized protein n=1 Tax=Chondrus crispus TaxID=2769 RepID=R7QCP5_CHOCR|nr:unnamed protein product [Chondrus crispus]CDF36282.1 unnamed protein product [Chondrus crispus]|eukprot:XP_005716101.1 unnamed protein product [Chondrus crispus]